MLRKSSAKGDWMPVLFAFLFDIFALLLRSIVRGADYHAALQVSVRAGGRERGRPAWRAGPCPVTDAFRHEHQVGLFAGRTRVSHGF